MRSSRILVTPLAVLAIMGGFAASAQADDANAAREDRFKAAYLFNFVKFVQWPASVAADTLTVCFVGGQGVYDALALGIENKRVGTRRLVVRRLQTSAASEGCNAIYLDAGIAPDASREAATNDMPILTVSDAKAFAHNGGMIELFTQSSRLRFSINLDNAQKAGLRISSSLLRLAATVERDD